MRECTVHLECTELIKHYFLYETEGNETGSKHAFFTSWEEYIFLPFTSSDCVEPSVSKSRVYNMHHTYSGLLLTRALVCRHCRQYLHWVPHDTVSIVGQSSPPCQKEYHRRHLVPRRQAMNRVRREGNPQNQMRPTFHVSVHLSRKVTPT